MKETEQRKHAMGGPGKASHDSERPEKRNAATQNQTEKMRGPGKGQAPLASDSRRRPG